MAKLTLDQVKELVNNCTCSPKDNAFRQYVLQLLADISDQVLVNWTEEEAVITSVEYTNEVLVTIPAGRVLIEATVTGAGPATINGVTYTTGQKFEFKAYTTPVNNFFRSPAIAMSLPATTVRLVTF